MLSAKKQLLIIMAFVMVFALIPLGNSNVYASKKPNPMKIKGKTVTVNYAVLQDGTQNLKVSKVIKFKKKGKGKLTYTKKSGNSKITVNKKTGKVTVKTGLKQGTYKVKIKVKAAGNKKYKKTTKTVTATVKVSLLKKKIFGINCVEQHGFWIPADLGTSQYTAAQLKNLGKSTDIDYLQRKINTASDAVRFFRVNGYKEGPRESIKDMLVKRTGTYETFNRTFCFLLNDNMTDTGLIYCTGSKQNDTICYLKKGKTYYAIQPFGMHSGNERIWMEGFKGGTFVNTNISAIQNDIKKYNLDMGTVKNIDTEEYPVAIDKPNCSKSYIQELVRKNLTLEEAAAKISTITDALNYLTARGYTVGKFGWNVGMRYPDRDELVYCTNYPFTAEDFTDEESANPIFWVTTLSADFTFRYNAGTCGGTANLINYLLKDDFDEEGYVEMRNSLGGHVLNYFKSGNTYYFCDFVNPAFTDDPYRYQLYKTTDPTAFAKYYRASNKRFEDKNSDFYLMNLYMYPKNGERQAFCGHPEKKDIRQCTPMGAPFNNYYPEDIADTINILFLREGYHMDPAPTPPEEALAHEVLFHNPVKDDNGKGGYEGL